MGSAWLAGLLRTWADATQIDCILLDRGEVEAPNSTGLLQVRARIVDLSRVLLCNK